MARQKEFDVDKALDDAMMLFWERGYERTSLNDLLGVMGIGRASFYNAFNNKHTLFLQALERYLRMANDQFIIHILTTATSPLAGIHRIFDEEITFLAEDSTQKGCMMVNCEIELANNDDDARKMIIASIDRVHHALAAALARAVEMKEIAPAHDAENIAHFLMNSLRGIKARARYNNKRSELKAIADITLAALNPLIEVIV